MNSQHLLSQQVPLDYKQPDGEKAAIAMVRLPANVSTDDPSYKGPVLMNPGGPGHSGVNYVVDPRPFKLHDIVGHNYDLIGFDPRGEYS